MSVPVLEAMDREYQLSSSKNAEIRFRWTVLCLRAGAKFVVANALDFVTSQGRMKFTRPLYKELFKVRRGGREGGREGRDLCRWPLLLSCLCSFSTYSLTSTLDYAWTMHTPKHRAIWPAPWPSRHSRKTPCSTTPQITHRSPIPPSVPPSPFFTHTEQNGQRLGSRNLQEKRHVLPPHLPQNGCC